MPPKRSCEDPDHERVPFGPLRLKMTPAQVQAIAKRMGTALSCSICKHRFEPGDTTFAHKCRTPTFRYEIVETKPMPALPSSLFYLDYQYGKKDES